MARIEVRGLKELDAALEQLPVAVHRRVINNALRAAGRVVVADAKKRVPVETGALKRSVVVRAIRNVQFVAGKGLRTAGQSRTVIGFLRPWSRYAHLVEFGTRKARAQPFLRPALDASRAAVMRKFAEVCAAGIAREAAKLRSRVR